VIFRCIAAPDAQFAKALLGFQGIPRNPKEREVMSPQAIGISTTYKTRVALEKPCRKP
jgi:phosphotransferase system IIA component